MTWCLDCVRALITAAAMGALESQVRRGFRHKIRSSELHARRPLRLNTLILERTAFSPRLVGGREGRWGRCAADASFGRRDNHVRMKIDVPLVERPDCTSFD